MVYPMLNAPGRAGGGWRGSFTQGTGGADDANRHFLLSDTSGLETVTIPRGAMIDDMDGVTPDWVFDFHNTSASYLYGAFFVNAKTSHTNFKSLLDAATGITNTDAGEPSGTGITSGYFTVDVPASIALSMEFGGYTPVTDAALTTYGQNFAVAVADYFQILEPALFSNAPVFYAPTVTGGGVIELTPSLYSNSQTFHAATVSQSGAQQSLTPSLFANSATFYALTVSPGSVTLSQSLFAKRGISWASSWLISLSKKQWTPNRLTKSKT
jgi:hypothetical protein